MAKPLFREFFRDYVELELKLDFDGLTEIQRSKQMARFFAQKVIGPLNPGLIPTVEEDMSAAIIDGADDCNIDFLAHEGGNVLIIQAKYSGHHKAGKRLLDNPDHFEAFRSALSRLYKGPKALKMNRKLREAIADIDFETATFQLFYITLRQPAQNSITQAQNGVEPIPSIPDLTERTTLELLDEEQLNVRLRDALSLAEDVSKPVFIRFSRDDEHGVPWMKHVDAKTGRTSYVGRINGSQVAEIFKAHRSRLFALNIRNYIGDNNTNKEIRRTAIGSPANFYYYNNGISALATRVESDASDKEGRTLQCEQFSIINGAQTVRSLFRAQSEDSNAVHDVELLMRVTVFGPKQSQAEQEFLDNVTKFNNTQNAIKISDFRSNDRIQMDLRSKFESLPARKGRKFLYKNKRSGEKEANRIAIGMEEFTKTIFAFLYGPDDVFGGTQVLFDTSKAGGYVRLFGANGEILPALSQAAFREYVGVWFVSEYVRDLWRQEGEANPSEALERRWMVFYAVGESLRVAYNYLGEDLPAAMQKLADPAWYIGPDDNQVKSVIRRHIKLAFASLKTAYAQASKEQDFRHRNWFRSEATLKAIRSQLETLWEIVSDTAKEYMFSRPEAGDRPEAAGRKQSDSRK